MLGSSSAGGAAGATVFTVAISARTVALPVTAFLTSGEP
jgi:hypothetical protein